VASEIDRQVKQMLEQAQTLALEVLRLNRSLLEEATQTLLKQEVLEGDRLGHLLAQVQAPASLTAWLASN
jgi:cell division protease FtsH